MDSLRTFHHILFSPPPILTAAASPLRLGFVRSKAPDRDAEAGSGGGAAAAAVGMPAPPVDIAPAATAADDLGVTWEDVEGSETKEVGAPGRGADDEEG